ncbi:aquaporin, partial [Microbacterium aurum]
MRRRPPRSSPPRRRAPSSSSSAASARRCSRRTTASPRTASRYTSVNPARSLAAAIYGGPDALAQLWVFLVFPIVGGLLAGFAHRALFDAKPA